MPINRKQLATLLEAAFDAGVNGCLDERDAVVMSLLAGCRHDGKYRYYSLAELRRLPNGRRLSHATEGDGEVVLNSETYGVKFRTRLVPFSPAEAVFWSCPLVG